MNRGTKPLTRLPKEYQRQFKDRRLATNINRLHVFSVYVVALQIVLNVINLLKSDGGETYTPDSPQIDIRYYVILSLCTLLTGAVYWVLLLLAKKEKIRRRRAKVFLTLSFLYVYVIIQLAFCTMNILSQSGVNSYIITILIIGMVPVIPPLQSILSICGAFLYTGAVMYFARDVSRAWSTTILTDNWANLIIITGLVICVSVLMYDMYVSNFLQSIRLEESNKELDGMANIDAMTGVANRRALSRAFREIWTASSARRGCLAVVILDIDFFKSYNDAFGHPAGDECLRRVAASLQNSFRRASDIVSRYGGEEFLVVFETNVENAFVLADAGRENVEKLCIPHACTEVSPYVTVSAGVCLVKPAPDITGADALKVADEALYESKKNGRNRTTLRTFAPGVSAPQSA